MNAKIINLYNIFKQNMGEKFKLLGQFKLYILLYMLFYMILLSFYLSPSLKHYTLFRETLWAEYSLPLELAFRELDLTIFALLFLVAISNMRNHPTLAKVIFLSSLFFSALFLEII